MKTKKRDRHWAWTIHFLIALLVLVSMLFAGCQLAPRHKRPPAPTPAAYPLVDAAPGVRPAAIGWRDFFADARLEILISSALENNRDLRTAVYRVEEARGLYRVQRADRLPNVNLGAEASRSRIPSGSITGSGLPSGALSDTDGITAERYSLDIGVSVFELDFWGRVKNLSEAARSEFLATFAAQRAFRLSLIRDVASAYLALQEVVERIVVAEATVASRREGVCLASLRFKAGVTSALDFYQAESLLTQAETELAKLRLVRAETENFLMVLAGGPLEGPLPEPLPLAQQLSPARLSSGLPSGLLTARPDILAAEERLRAARANIGVARAAFFPKITLTGSYGFSSSELEDLVRNNSRSWSIGPSVILPLFDFGRNRGNLTVAQARENIAVAAYERSIQTAFREVADGLAGRRYLAEQIAAQERNTETLRRIADLANKQYRAGVVNFLEVLDAERNLFDAEQAVLQVRRVEIENLVALYIALGGGLAE